MKYLITVLLCAFVLVTAVSAEPDENTERIPTEALTVAITPSPTPFNTATAIPTATATPTPTATPTSTVTPTSTSMPTATPNYGGDPYEPDSFEDPMIYTGRVRRTFSPATDVDYITLRIKSGRTKFETDNLTGAADTKMQLYDAYTGVELANNDDANGLASSITYNAEHQLDVVVVIRNVSIAHGRDVTYEFVATAEIDFTPTPTTAATRTPTAQATPYPTYTPFPTPTPPPPTLYPTYTPFPMTTAAPTRIWTAPTATPLPLPNEIVLGQEIDRNFEQGGVSTQTFILSAQPSVTYRCEASGQGVDTDIEISGSGVNVHNDDRAIGEIDPLVTWTQPAAAGRQIVNVIIGRIAGYGDFTVTCSAFAPATPTPVWTPTRVWIAPTATAQPTTVLVAHATRAPASVGDDGAAYVTVQNGDTQISIAAQQDIELAELQELNELKDESIIYPGERLMVRPPTEVTATSTPTPTVLIEPIVTADGATISFVVFMDTDADELPNAAEMLGAVPIELTALNLAWSGAVTTSRGVATIQIPRETTALWMSIPAVNHVELLTIDQTQAIAPHLIALAAPVLPVALP